MADDGNMDAHIRDFTGGKRRIEEHGVTLTDIVSSSQCRRHIK
jgi:hypothetical protein